MSFNIISFEFLDRQSSEQRILLRRVQPEFPVADTTTPQHDAYISTHFYSTASRLLLTTHLLHACETSRCTQKRSSKRRLSKNTAFPCAKACNSLAPSTKV